MAPIRLGTAFHETFALNLPSLAMILRLSHDSHGQLGYAAIRAATDLGTNYVKVMPRYARGCGLLEPGGFGLTPLGELVLQYNPVLSDPTTLWLMHYHLSAPHGPGPSFWSHLITHGLPFGEDASLSTIVGDLTRFLSSEQAGSLQERTIRSTATVFLGTYTKSDAFGRLGLFSQPTGRGPLSVRVADPQSPPPGAVAYALADYWEAHYGGQVTVSLSDLDRDDGFARLMWMDSRRLEQVLDTLRRERVLDVYRQAPPFQIVRHWSNKHDLLTYVYR